MKLITLRCIDRNWTQQIDNMNRFRESVSLRGYAQTNPLQDYVNEGWAMFREMLEVISLEVVLNLMNIKFEERKQEKAGFTINVAPTNNDNNVSTNDKNSENNSPVVNVVNTEKASLNISNIDKGKEAAPEYEHDDIHTN